MRRAYDARSKVVHGGVASDADLRNPDGERVTVDAFAECLEGVLRDSLQAAIDLNANGLGFPPDWAALMFALPES